MGWYTIGLSAPYDTYEYHIFVTNKTLNKQIYKYRMISERYSLLYKFIVK